MGNSQKENLKDQFETALKADNRDGAMGALRQMFINAVELKIKTTVTKGQKEQIETTINLLEGDITSSIHEIFAPDRESIAKFHQEQVNKAEEIIARNVATLKDLTKAVIDLFM